MRMTDDRLDHGTGDAPSKPPRGGASVDGCPQDTTHTANRRQNPCRERFRVSGFRPEGSEGKQNRTERNGTRQTPETGALSRHKKNPPTDGGGTRERACTAQRESVRQTGRAEDLLVH